MIFMVHIKLFVAFILAVAAIAPAVALPVGTQPEYFANIGFEKSLPGSTTQPAKPAPVPHAHETTEVPSIASPAPAHFPNIRRPPHSGSKDFHTPRYKLTVST